MPADASPARVLSYEELGNPSDAGISMRPDAGDSDGAAFELRDDVVMLGTRAERANVRVASVGLEGRP